MRILICLCVLLACGLEFAGASSVVESQSPEERAIESIRRDTTLEWHGYPLPLAAGWMDARRLALGFTPAYQIDQIRQGQYVLPWFTVSDDSFTSKSPGPYSTPGDALYYEPAVQYLAEHHLPLTFTMEEFEVQMARVSPEYAKAGGSGAKQIPLSPFGDTRPWYALGREWAHHKILRRLEQLYPDPPLVLILQDSEYPKLSANDLHAPYDPKGDPATMARRRAIGDAWIEKYRAMIQGFREGLESPAWRAHSVVAGYDQFVNSAMGRWGGWLDYSLYVPGRIEPWPFAWDGVSVSFYQHNYLSDSDFTVWSPEIETMNFVSERQVIQKAEPTYWFEMSTWDGQEPGQDSDKLLFYKAHGQQYTGRRYGGVVQFGMWLLRPRVVREFRNDGEDRIRFGQYFDAIMAAVARVHEDATLRTFWREGKLVENPVGGHPYQENLPVDIASRPRWFLLDTPLNPPRPWNLDTPLKVFALALELGQRPHREWLVYAFSPLDESIEADVRIPDGPQTRVHATVGGAFTLVKEGEPAGSLLVGS